MAKVAPTFRTVWPSSNSLEPPKASAVWPCHSPTPMPIRPSPWLNACGIAGDRHRNVAECTKRDRVAVRGRGVEACRDRVAATRRGRSPARVADGDGVTAGIVAVAEIDGEGRRDRDRSERRGGNQPALQRRNGHLLRRNTTHNGPQPAACRDWRARSVVYRRCVVFFLDWRDSFLD